jgi:hypothetical protein
MYLYTNLGVLFTTFFRSKIYIILFTTLIFFVTYKWAK